MNHAVFPASIFFALCIHGALFFFINLLFSLPEPEPKRSIPVTLRSTEVAASKASKAKQVKQETQSSKSREVIDSDTSSQFKTTTSKQLAQEQSKGSKAHKKPKQSKPDIPALPSFSSSQASRAQKARQGGREMFEAKDIEQISEIKQISTEELPPITDYELTLIQHMVKAELYDRFHPIMANAKKESIGYILKLNLFANGAIKKASIRQSSGISQIDQLAIQAAYNASPFPRPPKADLGKNFTYMIPITYEK